MSAQHVPAKIIFGCDGCKQVIIELDATSCTGGMGHIPDLWSRVVLEPGRPLANRYRINKLLCSECDDKIAKAIQALEVQNART